MKMVAAFKAATGVEVNVVNESFDDIQPKASVVANTGQGLDMVWGLYSLPHLFPQKCIDQTDVADYLGKKYGGWTPAAEMYGKSGGKWIGIPIATTGGLMNYRISSMQKAGFKEFPTDTASFLELVKALKKNNTPAGFALGILFLQVRTFVELTLTADDGHADLHELTLILHLNWHYCQAFLGLCTSELG